MVRQLLHHVVCCVLADGHSFWRVLFHSLLLEGASLHSREARVVTVVAVVKHYGVIVIATTSGVPPL